MNGTSNLPQLVPDPIASWEQERRFRHRDITELTAAQVWAERVLIGHRLAELLFARERERVIYIADEGAITDQSWLRERLRRLEAVRRQETAA